MVIALNGLKKLTNSNRIPLSFLTLGAYPALSLFTLSVSKCIFNIEPMIVFHSFLMMIAFYELIYRPLVTLKRLKILSFFKKKLKKIKIL